MNKILLQCDNLSKRYQEGTVQTDVLHNVSFSVGEGEMMAIVGSSGSGKSTLLHLLGGLDTPTNGDVIFSGQPMSKMSSAAKAELRNRELGFIYQFHHLLPDFTALENVAMPLLIGKKKPAEINARASDMLKAVGLGEDQPGGNHRLVVGDAGWKLHAHDTVVEQAPDGARPRGENSTDAGETMIERAVEHLDGAQLAVEEDDAEVVDRGGEETVAGGA